MIKKIPAQSLRVGMFLEKIDASWLSTPFLRNQFKIISGHQIKKITDCGIREVYIDTDKGIDVAPAEAAPKETALGNADVEYMAISVDRLAPYTTLPFGLFLKKDGAYSLYLQKGLPLHGFVLRELESQKTGVYIRANEKGLLEKYEKSTEKEKALSLEGLVPNFETQEKVEQYNHYLNNYIPVDPSVFSPGLKVPLCIYLGKGMDVTLVLEAGSLVPESETFSPQENGHRKNFLIRVEDAEIYKNFVKKLASGRAAGNPDQAAKVRSAVIKENSKMVMKELMDNPRSGEAMKETKGIVSDMIENILENPSSFYSLMRINTHDYYTYVHSINVSTFSIGLGSAMGMKKVDLSCLAMGALMHDMGKSQVPTELINKPGKLTDEEFIQIKRHVNLGLEILNGQGDLSPRALFAVVQHHEKLNGTGYPNKLTGEKIHIFGRIASVLDVYDALTTERSYKKAFKPFDAAALLAKSKDEFDQEIVRNFVGMLGRQNF
jgi:putative nucleotidyltransferase with HDIG domain